MMSHEYESVAAADVGPRLIDIQRIRLLPQSADVWQLAVRDTPPSCDPAQLYRLLVLVGGRSNMIRQMIPLTSELGDEGQIVSALEVGMLSPPEGIEQERPPAIWVDDDRVAERIALPMEACGVEVVVKPSLPAIAPVLESLSRQTNVFSQGPLLGTTVFQEELAEAAARVAKVEPWRYFQGETPLEVRELGEAALPRSIVVVLGQMREVEGVASYNHEDAYLQLSNLTRDMSIDDGDLFVNSLTFERVSETPAETRAAFRRHGFAAVHGLYPCFMNFALGGRPDVLRQPLGAQRLLRDLHVVAALIEQDGERVADGSWRRCRLEYEGRQLEIISRRDLIACAAETSGQPSVNEPPAEDGRLPHLLNDSHSLLVSDLPLPLVADLVPAERLSGLSAGEQPGTVRALVVKATKRVAQRACRDMARADSLGFASFQEPDGRNHEVVLAYAAGEPLFLLASVPESDDVPRLSEVVAGGEPSSLLLLVFVGGGARRSIKRLKPASVIGAYALPHRTLPRSS